MEPLRRDMSNLHLEEKCSAAHSVRGLKEDEDDSEKMQLKSLSEKISQVDQEKLIREGDSEVFLFAKDTLHGPLGGLEYSSFSRKRSGSKTFSKESPMAAEDILHPMVHEVPSNTSLEDDSLFSVKETLAMTNNEDESTPEKEIDHWENERFCPPKDVTRWRDKTLEEKLKALNFSRRVMETESLRRQEEGKRANHEAFREKFKKSRPMASSMDVDKMILDNIKLCYTTLELHLEAMRRHNMLISTHFKTIELSIDGLKIIHESRKLVGDLVRETFTLIRSDLASINSDVKVFWQDMNNFIDDLGIISNSLANFRLDPAIQTRIFFQMHTKTDVLQSRINVIVIELIEIRKVTELVEEKIKLTESYIEFIPTEEVALRHVSNEAHTMILAIHSFLERIQIEMEVIIQKFSVIEDDLLKFIKHSTDLILLESPPIPPRAKKMELIKSNVDSFVKDMEMLVPKFKSISIERERIQTTKKPIADYFKDSDPGKIDVFDLKTESRLFNNEIYSKECNKRKHLEEKLLKAGSLSVRFDRTTPKSSRRHLVVTKGASPCSSSYHFTPSLNNFQSKVKIEAFPSNEYREMSTHQDDFKRQLPQVEDTFQLDVSMSEPLKEIIDSIIFTIRSDMKTLHMFKRMVNKDIKFLLEPLKIIHKILDGSPTNFNEIYSILDGIVVSIDNINAGMESLKIDAVAINNNVENFHSTLSNIKSSKDELKLEFNSIQTYILVVKSNFEQLHTDILVIQMDLEAIRNSIEDPKKSLEKIKKLVDFLKIKMEAVKKDLANIFGDIDIILKRLETIKSYMIDILSKQEDDADWDLVSKVKTPSQIETQTTSSTSDAHQNSELGKNLIPGTKSRKRPRSTSQKTRKYSMIELGDVGTSKKEEEVKTEPLFKGETNESLSESGTSTSDSESSQKGNKIVVHLDNEVIKASVENIRRDAKIIMMEMSYIKNDMEIIKQNVEAIQGDMSTLQDNINNFQPDLNVVKSNMERIKPNVNYIINDMDTINFHIQAIQSDLHKVFSLNVSLVHENTLLIQQDLEMVQKDIRITRTDLEMVRPDLENLQPMISKAHSDLANVHKGIKMLQEDLEGIHIQVDNIQPADSYPPDLEKIRQCVETLRVNMEGAAKSMETFLNDLQTLRPDLEIIQWQLEFIQWEMENVREDLESTRTDLESLKLEFPDSGSDWGLVRHAISLIQKDTENLTRGINVVKPDLETIHKDMENMRPHLEAIGQDMDVIKWDMDKIHGDVSTIKENITAFQSRYQW